MCLYGKQSNTADIDTVFFNMPTHKLNQATQVCPLLTPNKAVFLFANFS